MNQKKISEIITKKLQDALAPEVLTVVDDSAKHAGHVEAGSETHFRIKVISKKFDGMTQLQRHRLVYDILDEEIKTRVHALALTTKDHQ